CCAFRRGRDFSGENRLCTAVGQGWTFRLDQSAGGRTEIIWSLRRTTVEPYVLGDRNVAALDLAWLLSLSAGGLVAMVCRAFASRSTDVPTSAATVTERHILHMAPAISPSPSSPSANRRRERSCSVAA